MDIEGYPVLETVPDFTDDPESSARRGFNLVALSPARRVAAYRGKWILEGLSHKFVFTSREQAASFAAFFEGRCGRWQPFWVPSWRMDLSLFSTLANGSSDLFIEHVGSGSYKSVYAPATSDSKALGRRLYIFTTDFSAVFAPRVDAAANLDDSERLTLDTPAPADFPLLSTVICFLHFVRFVDDALTLRYSGPGAAECEAGFVELATSEVEADA